MIAFMDYGPDWPPVPPPPPPSPPPGPAHPLLRRCVTITLVWVAIWVICAVALEFRPPYELRFPAAHDVTSSPGPVAVTR